MIKFFRHIRQRMMFKKRFSRYLLYAIGEIILVVIGILLALEINEWNNSIEENQREKYLLTELQKEFTRDSIQLERLIFLTDVKSKDGQVVQSFLKGENTPRDTILTNAILNGRLLIFRSFTPNNDEILSTGQQHILKSDSLKELIKEFKEYLIDIEEFLLNECKEIKQEYNFHLYKYFDRQILTEFWKNIDASNKYIPIDSLGDFKTDIEGYRNDPQSLYFASMNTGADSDLNRSYKVSIRPRLSAILKKLRVLNDSHK